MGLEIPELFQANVANVDNVVALRNGRLGIYAGHHGAQWGVESCEQLIEGEEAHVLGRDIGKGRL